MFAERAEVYISVQCSSVPRVELGKMFESTSKRKQKKLIGCHIGGLVGRALV